MEIICEKRENVTCFFTKVPLKTNHLHCYLHVHHHHVHHSHLLLVLHEDVAEGAVEHGVDQVGQAQVEDEQVGHRSHLVMTCHGNP